MTAEASDLLCVERRSASGRARSRKARPPRLGRLSLTTSLALIAPLSLLLGLFFYWPVVTFLLRSVTEPHLTLDHYGALLREGLYLRVMLRTLWIAAATTGITLVLGYPIALLMARSRGWVAGLIAACVLIPLWTSVLVRSYAWIVLLQRNGLINSWLKALGLIEQPLPLLYTTQAVLIAMSQVLLPFMILPIYSVLRNVPRQYEAAARGLGAGPLSAFVFITLPLSLQGIVAGCVIVFVLALGFYITPALVGGSQTLMLATLISQEATGFLNWPFAAALSVVLLAISLGLAYAFRRLLRVEGAVVHE